MAQKALKNLATCRTCHHQAPTMEFFMPDVFCSQACYDKSRPSGHRQESTTTGKRKKKRASYLECYEQDYSILELNTANKRRERSSSSASKQFNYNQFVLDEELIETPNNIFSYRDDTVENGFQIDMKLEGIDPQHPSLYCVLTVTEVKGQRIRLRFDGYGDLYDFWTYCYSEEIFPAGWCERNKKKICPPRSWKSEVSFSWSTYKQQTKCETAPPDLFTVSSSEELTKTSSFRINDKLEAADIKNNMLVCVASVADTYADNMLIHFDGWEDAYDYWCKSDSPNIHPVGWCLANRQVLSAPNGYPDATNFKWETYFTETNSRPAPASQFGKSKDNKFEVGMVVEVVDKRNPGLIRVAQITSSIGNRIKVHFSGWDDKYDFWIEQDSYDLHPPGRCEKTGHPLTAPLTPLDIAIQRGGCATPGCTGVGHVKHSKYTCHSSNVGCPYSDCNLKKDSPVPDRFAGIEQILNQYSSIDNVKTVYHQPLISPNQVNKTPLHSPPISAVRKRASNSYNAESTPPTKVHSSRSSHKSEPMLSNSVNGVHRSNSVLLPVTRLTNSQPAPTTLDIEVYRSVFLSGLPLKYKENGQLPTVTANIIKTLLTGYQESTYDEAVSWSPEQVVKFLRKVVPSLTANQISKFMEQNIDGEALLLLEQSDIISYLALKLGPALKIYNSIKLIKSQKPKPAIS